MLKKIRYLIEAALANRAFNYFQNKSFAEASDTGGAIFRKVGPYLGRTKIARGNLGYAFPDKADAEIDQIIRDMWENFGRVLGEFPHMGRMSKHEMDEILEVEGLEHLETLRKLDKGSIWVSGHLANWELSCKALHVNDFSLLLVYRKGNNPALDRIIQETRGQYQVGGIPKGKAGARVMVQAIKERKHTGVLIDQKMNDGIPVKFFGREAMTGPAIARIALKFGCPIVPAHVVRIDGHKQKFIISPPFEVEKTNDPEADVMNIMTKVNGILEGWIRESPSQWIWIHNRWPK